MLNLLPLSNNKIKVQVQISNAHTYRKPFPFVVIFMQPSLQLLLLFSLTVFSCRINDKNPGSQSDTIISSVDTTQKINTTKTQKSTQTTSTDTLIIDRKVAVFYQPDSMQMEKRMQQVGEADFRAGMDDYIYYINTSAEYLNKQNINEIDAKNKKFLKF